MQEQTPCSDAQQTQKQHHGMARTDIVEGAQDFGSKGDNEEVILILQESKVRPSL